MFDRLKKLFTKSIPPASTGDDLYSTNVVGFANREVQYKTYAKIASIIPSEDSILDFGCGRGDYFGWHASVYGTDMLKYIGIDLNKSLINAGKEIFANIKLINKDWNRIQRNVSADWSININSNNLQYNKTKVDEKYLYKTIDSMYKHAKKGVIILLASDLTKEENAWIKYNPGKVLNWTRMNYDKVMIDHSSFANSFILIIHKTNN